MSANIQNVLSTEINRLQSIESPSICVQAVEIALMDKQVQGIIVDKNGQGHIPTGIYCETPHILEEITVVFVYRCANDTICLIPPTFAVTVDIINKKVIKIQDPYFPIR